MRSSAWMAASLAPGEAISLPFGAAQPVTLTDPLAWQFSFGLKPWGHLRGTERHYSDVSCHDQPFGHSDRTKTATITTERP